jgi:hypothetical protein
MTHERGDDAWRSPLYVRPGTPERSGPRDDLYFAEHPRRQYRLRNTTIGECKTYGEDTYSVVVHRTGTKVPPSNNRARYPDRERYAALLFAEGAGKLAPAAG